MRFRCNDSNVFAAQLRVCADGGANRVFDDLPLLFPHETPSDVRTRFGFYNSVASYEIDNSNNLYLCICTSSVLGTSLM